MTKTDTVSDQQGAKTDIFSMNVKAQYIKDISFENPKAPASLRNDIRPEIQMVVNVQAKKLEDNVFEVSLLLNINGVFENEKIFIVELVYAGVFQFEDIKAYQLEYVLMVECARLLFPFARQIIAQVTADGGYPPLNIQPIDFLNIFQKNKLKRQETEENNASLNKTEGNA